MRIFISAGLVWLLPTVSFAATPVKPLVDSDWLKANGCNAGVVILDIRSEKIDGQSVDDYRKGHVPCAVHTDYHAGGWRAKVDDTPGMLPPIERLEALIGSLGIDNDIHVVIAPRGNSAKSMGAGTRVYWTFKVLGHDQVSILDGGTDGFAANKANILESGMRKPKPRSFKATLRSDMLVNRKQVQQAISGEGALVDYRSPDQFLGINRHPKVKLRGTLTGASNLPIEWLTVDNSGRFRSQQGLRDAYQHADIALDRGHIAFCNTGHNSAIGWFVANELLGNKDVRMYDGSMAQWTRQDNPAVDQRLGFVD